MRNYDCPQCGAAVPFRSSVTVFATCGFCRSMVVRQDAEVSLMGTQAVLPPDLSPLTIGTRGTWGGRAFTLVGRVRLTYDEGAWTEWCADFGSGQWGWVAEAQGLYYVSLEIAVPADFPGMQELAAMADGPPGGLRLGDPAVVVGRAQMELDRQVGIGGATYVVSDVKQATVQAAEGELTFAAVPGRSGLSVDLRGEGDAFASAEYASDGVRLFVGRIARFEDLGFTELRPVPGWTVEAGTVKGQTAATVCPRCGAPVEVRAAGFSLTATCGNCSGVLDATDPGLKLIGEAGRAQSVEQLVPLGSRGEIGGTTYECIGMMRRRDQYDESWAEYLLFNPFAGYRWLVTYSGHWSLVEVLAAAPKENAGQPVWRGQAHRLFARAKTEVTYVLGEFYWRVQQGEVSFANDYIAPPLVLSEESYPGLSETTWSAGEYLAPGVVQAAFRLTKPLPEPSGPYLNEPNPHREKGRTLRWLFPVAALLVLLIQALTASNPGGRMVFESSFVYRAAETNVPVVTQAFRVEGTRPQAIEIGLSAPVENQWFAVDIDLVEVATKKVREVGVGVEFYSGFDDGPWSEGSTTASTVVPSVAPGSYYLVVQAATDPAVTEMGYELRVKRGVTLWSNFWIAMVALTVYPAFRWIRELTFERRRWSQSDDSPHAVSGAGDDDEDDA